MRYIIFFEINTLPDSSQSPSVTGPKLGHKVNSTGHFLLLLCSKLNTHLTEIRDSDAKGF